MLLLALETAADVCSVAFFRDGTLAYDASLSVPRQHASQLLPLVHAGLGALGTEAGDLEAIAVSAGPGSYTGLRIGLSTAQGLATAAEASLLMVPTLEALARHAPEHKGWTAAALPSRRGEVYLGVFDAGATLHEPESVAVADAVDRLPPGGGVIVGPAAGRLTAVAAARPDVRLAPSAPSAVAVGRLGWALYQEGQAVSPGEAGPEYLRATVATPPGARA